MGMPTDDKTALTLTMLGEARGQGIVGMRCVGHVICNRAAAGDWRGKTVLEVCLHPYQFSCWNENDPNRDYLIHNGDTDPMHLEAETLAEQLLDRKLEDLTGGANAYYAAGTPEPKWAIGKTPCFTYRQHIFYKGIA